MQAQVVKQYPFCHVLVHFAQSMHSYFANVGTLFTIYPNAPSSLLPSVLPKGAQQARVDRERIGTGIQSRVIVLRVGCFVV